MKNPVGKNEKLVLFKWKFSSVNTENFPRYKWKIDSVEMKNPLTKIKKSAL
jgi:hypothetical protein